MRMPDDDTKGLTMPEDFDPRMLKSIPTNIATALIGDLQNGRPEDFRGQLQAMIKDVCADRIDDARRAALYRFGLHYISPTFGRWTRVAIDPEYKNGDVDANPFSKPSRIELDAHSALYTEVIPRDRNLLVHAGLNKHFAVKFGGTHEADWLCFSNDCLREYKNLAETTNVFSPTFLKDDADTLQICNQHQVMTRFLMVDFAAYFLARIDDDNKNTLYTTYPVSRKPLAAINAVLAADGELLRKWYKYVSELFLTTFFPTLQTCIENGNNEVYVELMPHRITARNIGEEESSELCASTAIAYGATPIPAPVIASKGKPSEAGIAKSDDETKDPDDRPDEFRAGVMNYLNDVIDEVLMLDLWVAHRYGIRGTSSVFVEDVCRECASVDATVLARLNRFPQYLREMFADSDEICPGKEPLKDVLRVDKCPTCRKDCKPDCPYWELTDPAGDRSMIVASESYREMLADLKRRIEDKDKPKDDRDANKARVTVIYLFGEPGTGKDNVAKLCHILSVRSREPQRREDILQDFASSAIPLDLKRVFDRASDLPEDDRMRLRPKNRRARNTIEALVGARPMANYVARNAGLITADNMASFLYGRWSADNPGRVSQLGALVLAHLLGGTAFLDEFNTLQPAQLAQQLLRVLEKPHEVLLEEGSQPLGLNVLLVIAGNLDRDGLLGAGFNPALVFRICEHQVTIPPLRERREDIAVFILGRCVQFNREHENLKIRRIDGGGIHLLCNLPWETNYRGLKAYMDDLLGDRRVRKVSDAEVSFDEIVACLNRRDLLSGKRIEIREDAYHDKTKP